MTWTPPNENMDFTLAQPPKKSEQEDSLSPVERRMLERGKKEHRETTEATQRVLKVAEQTAEMASETLIEVKRQGHMLDKTQHSLETVEKDVHEASRIVKFMRRWCCFQVICCCDCFDPDVTMDRTRQRRLQQRHKEFADLHETQFQVHLKQQEAVYRLKHKQDPAFSGDEAAARSELFAATIRHKSAPGGNNDAGLGYGLPDADRAELDNETRLQDDNLDRIGTTVETLKAISLEMQDEFAEQAPQLDSISDRAHNVHDDLKGLTRLAGKV